MTSLDGQAIAASRTSTAIELSRVARRYHTGAGVVTALEDVDLHVDSGEFVVVLGPSGSGKTTLLDLIGALDVATEGSVVIAGERLDSRSKRELFRLRRADERRRQHATMFAFGLPVRRVVLMILIESVIIGVMGTAVGILFGYAVVQWIVHTMLPDTVPDLGVVTHLAGGTVLTAAIMGIVAVGLAPLFTIRRLLRTRIPEALRVVE